MTISQISKLGIFYLGLCSGLLLFALILVVLLSSKLWNSSKASMAAVCERAFYKDWYSLIFVAVSFTALIAMRLAFQEPARPVLPEPPEFGRYLLTHELDPIAQFQSKSDCQFAKTSILANHSAGKNLEKQLLCIYLGKGSAMPQ